MPPQDDEALDGSGQAYHVALRSPELGRKNLKRRKIEVGETDRLCRMITEGETDTRKTRTDAHSDRDRETDTDGGHTHGTREAERSGKVKQSLRRSCMLELQSAGALFWRAIFVCANECSWFHSFRVAHARQTPSLEFFGVTNALSYRRRSLSRDKRLASTPFTQSSPEVSHPDVPEESLIFWHSRLHTHTHTRESFTKPKHTSRVRKQDSTIPYDMLGRGSPQPDGAPWPCP